MTATVTHAFNCALADDPKASAAGEILVSHWNAGHVVSGIRDILTANRSYYVSATGSDSNGGTNSTTDAWFSLQHAMDFVSSNLDIAGFIITINIGAGTFTGFGVKATVGGGILQFQGAGVGVTTISGGPNDGVFNFGECCSIIVPLATIIALNNVTISGTGYSLLALYAEGQMTLGIQPNLGSVELAPTHVGQNLAFVQQRSFLYGSTNSTLKITVPAGYLGYGFVVSSNGVFIMNTTINMTGGPTFGTNMFNGGFILCYMDGVVDGVDNGLTWTGTGTGLFAIALENGVIEVPFDPTAFGFINIADGFGCFNESRPALTVSILNLNLPANNNTGSRLLVSDATQTLAAGLGTTVVVGGANITPVYSDGTNWIIG